MLSGLSSCLWHHDSGFSSSRSSGLVLYFGTQVICCSDLEIYFNQYGGASISIPRYLVDDFILWSRNYDDNRLD